MTMEKPFVQKDPMDSGRLADLLNHNTDWVWEVDTQGRYVWSSEVVMRLLGYSAEEVLGRTPFDFMVPGEAERLESTFRDVLSSHKPFSGLINRNLRADGRAVILETSGIPLFDENGQLTGYRGTDRDISQLGERVLQLESIYQNTPMAVYDAGGNVAGISSAWMDITDRKLAEQQLAHANQTLLQYAERDHLTGLFNRRYMDDRLSYEITRAQREGSPLSLCMADIDFFKRYNDTYGHPAGDQVLRAVADALRGGLRPGDSVSRYGGEEFLVILPDTSAEGALAVAERLRERVMALEIVHETNPIGSVLTISLGVMTWDSPLSVCSIQSVADIAA